MSFPISTGIALSSRITGIVRASRLLLLGSKQAARRNRNCSSTPKARRLRSDTKVRRLASFLTSTHTYFRSGVLKLAPLSSFFDSIIDGTADLTVKKAKKAKATTSAASVTAETSTPTPSATTESIAEPEAKETPIAASADAETQSDADTDAAAPAPEQTPEEPVATADAEATPKHEEL